MPPTLQEKHGDGKFELTETFCRNVKHNDKSRDLVIPHRSKASSRPRTHFLSSALLQAGLAQKKIPGPLRPGVCPGGWQSASADVRKRWLL